jgi:hypothetical protein
MEVCTSAFATFTRVCAASSAAFLMAASLCADASFSREACNSFSASRAAAT